MLRNESESTAPNETGTDVDGKTTAPQSTPTGMADLVDPDRGDRFYCQPDDEIVVVEWNDGGYIAIREESATRFDPKQHGSGVFTDREWRDYLHDGMYRPLGEVPDELAPEA